MDSITFQPDPFSFTTHPLHHPPHSSHNTSTTAFPPPHNVKGQDGSILTTLTNISSDSRSSNGSGPFPPFLDPNAYGDHVDFFPYAGDVHLLTLPWVREPNFVVVVVVQVVTFLLGISGNVLVIAVLCCGRPARCVTFPCLLSVAVADVSFLAVCIPHEVLRHFLTDWKLSAYLCKLSGFVETASALAAVLNLVLISLERYFVIAHPLMSKWLCTSRKAKLALTSTWIAAFSLSTPAFLVMDTEVNVYYNNVTQAQVALCGDYGLGGAGRTAWAAWRLLLLLLLPAIFLLFCYVRVILILWTSTHHLHTMTASSRLRGGHNSSSTSSSSRNGPRVESASSSSRGWWKVGSADRCLLAVPSAASSASSSSSSGARSSAHSSLLSRNPGEEAMQARRQVIRMLVVIIVVFLLCWGPHLVISLVKRLQLNVYTPHAYHVWVMFSFLPYVQSVVNPVIYVLMSRNLRRSIAAFPCIRYLRHCTCRCGGAGRRRGGKRRKPTQHELLTASQKHSVAGGGEGSGSKGSGSGSGGAAEMKTAVETIPSYGASELTEV